jgi:hypothetical protein
VTATGLFVWSVQRSRRADTPVSSRWPSGRLCDARRTSSLKVPGVGGELAPTDFGSHSAIDLRKAWPDEAAEFTPEMLEHLDRMGAQSGHAASISVGEVGTRCCPVKATLLRATGTRWAQ